MYIIHADTMSLLTNTINAPRDYIYSTIIAYIIIIYSIGLYRVAKAIYEIIFSTKFP